MSLRRRSALPPFETPSQMTFILLIAAFRPLNWCSLHRGGVGHTGLDLRAYWSHYLPLARVLRSKPAGGCTARPELTDVRPQRGHKVIRYCFETNEVFSIVNQSPYSRSKCVYFGQRL